MLYHCICRKDNSLNKSHIKILGEYHIFICLFFCSAAACIHWIWLRPHAELINLIMSDIIKEACLIRSKHYYRLVSQASLFCSERWEWMQSKFRKRLDCLMKQIMISDFFACLKYFGLNNQRNTSNYWNICGCFIFVLA